MLQRINMIRISVGSLLLLCLPLAAQDPPGLEKSKLRPREGALKVGAMVPAFEVRDLEGKNPTSLETLKGKPTVLIFGSCT
jgi:cytochrome oxidase Cu insertion factor (SCO1/SenC/PrrC family)